MAFFCPLSKPGPQAQMSTTLSEPEDKKPGIGRLFVEALMPCRLNEASTDYTVEDETHAKFLQRRPAPMIGHCRVV